MQTRRDYENLLVYIRARLKPLDDQKETYELAEGLVQSLTRKDSVITLNYDTLVERHLSQTRSEFDHHLRLLESLLTPPGTAYGGSAEPMLKNHSNDGRGLLLKLHGSLNWFACSNESCAYHAHIQPSQDWILDKGDVFGEKDWCALCGSPPQVVIVPPIANKAIERFPKLTLMWTHAHRALKHSIRWTFIGISMAPTDFHLAALIRSASRGAGSIRRNGGPCFDVCVVDKDKIAAECIAKRIYCMMPPDAQHRIQKGECRISYFGSLDDYMDEIERIDCEREDAPQNTH